MLFIDVSQYITRDDNNYISTHITLIARTYFYIFRIPLLLKYIDNSIQS